MTLTWLLIFSSWTVLAAVDLALAVAFAPHPVTWVFTMIASMCGVFAGRALHKANVERRFRRVEALAKRYLSAMEACAKNANPVGYYANKEQLQGCCAEMLRIAKD